MDSPFPALDAGVTYLDDEDAPSALYRLVGGELADATGPAYWVDARNAASPAALREHAPRAAWQTLRVARAFTGYQHHELVRSLPGELRSAASLVVAPNAGSLYADGDVPGFEADALVDATLAVLGALADAVDVPVVVTDQSPYRDAVRGAADRALDAERTRAGLRVEGPDAATTVYWDDWGYQTTIPYWVDLLGAVESRDAPGAAGVAVPGV